MPDGAWQEQQDGDMAGWRSLPLAPAFAIDATASAPPLTAGQAQAVDGLWAQACRDRPSMFDGRIFALARIGPARAEGYWTSYRRAYAQLRRPDLFDPPLRALAVNGVLISTDDRVLLARRHAGAIYLPGGWQTPPAGSVEDRGDGDALDLAAQLTAEAVEELGVTPGMLEPPRPLLAIEHAHTHVVDIGLLVRCRCDSTTLRHHFAARDNPEYDALEAVPLADLPSLLAGPLRLLPTGRLLLRAIAPLPATG